MEFHTCFATVDVTFVPGLADIVYREIPNDTTTYTLFDQRMDSVVAASASFTMV